MSFSRTTFLLLALLLTALTAASQSLDIQERASPASARLNRVRGLDMLRQIKTKIEQEYYDKNYRGIDIDARFKEAEEKIEKLDANRHIYRVIAQVLLDFNDSHTRFVPPGRANRVDYGFTMQMVGKTCYIVDVKKGSDADKKGVRIGDTVNSIGGIVPNRENLWKINYILYSLDPQEGLRLELTSPANAPKAVDVIAKFSSIAERRREEELRKDKGPPELYRCRKIDEETAACKLQRFAVEKRTIDKMMKEAAPYKKLVLDLRGNGGGYVKMEQYLTGFFFDREVKIADVKKRGKESVRLAKRIKNRIFNGKLAVLIDSNSASAAEVFARVIQIEKRGIIVGDTSAGKVMTSRTYSMLSRRGGPGQEIFALFGVRVTIGELVMADGSRLEHVGVVPDYTIGPTASALAEGGDPILAYAANILGTRLTAKEAGKFHFLLRKQEEDEPEADDEGEADK